MPRSQIVPQPLNLLLILCLTLLSIPACALTPGPAANSAFDGYIALLERRFTENHRSPAKFLALVANNPEAARLRSGELLLEDSSPQYQPAGPGALLHHWRGTAFVAGAHAADFTSLLQNTAIYPRVFAPQVLRASTLTGTAGHQQILLRVAQHHGLTVTFDTAYNTAFGQLDPQHAFSTSRSTAITELDHPGTSREHPLTSAEDHGFLWRQNTYWSYEERDGGLYLQLESVSLTRSIPTGLNWLIGPYLQSIPRDSLAFTLHAACNALRR